MEAESSDIYVTSLSFMNSSNLILFENSKGGIIICYVDY
jgi:hypothetical protein